MNATKFVVLLVIGVMVCANVGARKLEGVSKETKFDISIPKTAATNGIGAKLDRVYSSSSTYISNYGNGNADGGPNGPNSSGTGSQYTSTGSSVDAAGPSATASTSSGGNGQAEGSAAVAPGVATGSGSASGGSSSNGNGQTGGSR